jgi:guanylate kinase
MVHTRSRAASRVQPPAGWGSRRVRNLSLTGRLSIRRAMRRGASAAGSFRGVTDGSISPGARGRLTVLSGPSGVGKGTVVAALRRLFPHVWVSVSVTTRAPRPGETDGVQYRFVDPARFQAMVDAGELLEHAFFAGNHYGTPRGPVEARLADGVPTLLEIELQGARQVRRSMPGAQFVFLAPPSWQELEARLVGRGTESPEVIGARLARARIELGAQDEFDATVINDDVELAAAELVRLIESANRASR